MRELFFFLDAIESRLLVNHKANESDRIRSWLKNISEKMDF